MPQSSKRQSIALQNCLFYPSFSGVFFNQLALQKRRFNTLAVTVGFVAFANYGNQVALLRVVNGVMQGIQPVGNFHILGVRVALGHAGFDVRDNIFHFFQSGCCLRSGC